jgi:hypothetical protein
MDAERADIEPTLGYDIPSEGEIADSKSQESAPAKLQNSRNKPGMFMKTKGDEPDVEMGNREQGTANRQRTVGSSEVGALDRRL